MKKIQLIGKYSLGKFSIVDDEDYEKFSIYRWYAHKDTTGLRAVRKQNNKTIYLSREIMNAGKNTYVDHINHNTLDDRKENLRICNASQNMMNRSKQKNSKYKYKGIHRSFKKYKMTKPYAAQIKIQVNGKKKHIYSKDYKTVEEAAKAYDELAIKYFGEFACLNFPINKREA